MPSTDLAPLSDRQRAIIELCRTFAAAEIPPVACAFDDADVATLWRLAAKAGITAYMLPAEYGGGGFTDVFTQCLALEQLSAAGGAIAKLLTSSGFFAGPILGLGTAEQKERWLRPLTSDDPPMTALAVTEPDVGADSPAITTKARRVGSGYKLTGQTTWISNGCVADFYVIFATIESTRRANGVTAFLVEKGVPGLTCATPVADAASVFLEEVFVPDAHRLGNEGEGFRGLAHTFDISRTMMAASSIGAACASLAAATEYACGRTEFDQPAVESRLTEMAARIEASRLLTWEAAKIIDGDGDGDGDGGTVASSRAERHAFETERFCASTTEEIIGRSALTGQVKPASNELARAQA